MKSLLAALAATLVIPTVPAQNAGPTPPPDVRRILREAKSDQPVAFADESRAKPQPNTPDQPDSPGKEVRFNLDFPGGTPAELGEAISKAVGRRLNLIVSSSAAKEQVRPIRVEQCTVAELFTAISNASAREQTTIAGATGANGQFTYNTINRPTRLVFAPSTPPTSYRTVWTANMEGPTQEDLDAFARRFMATPNSDDPGPPSVVNYFQLDPWLQRYSIDDITTAIRTGWKMKGVDPEPKLSFHKETNLLIAVGDAADVVMIKEVLGVLPQGPKAPNSPESSPAPTPSSVRRMLRPSQP